MFKVGTMLKAREVRLSRKKPPYHPALIPGTSPVRSPPQLTRNVGLRKENDQSNRDTEIEIDFCLALLLDFAMPGTSGAQVARRVRAS